MSISVCIVTYNPDTEILFKIIHILRNSGLSIILVDNNSSDKSFLSLLQNVDIIMPLENNVGLGKAYNICCEASKKLGAEWILFLDQDSIPLEPFKVNEVIEKLKNYAQLYYNTAIVSINSDIATKTSIINDDFYLAKYVVGSGMIVKNCVCEKYKFLENLFLYSIDIEYSVRLRRAGYYILAYKKQMLKYRMGEIYKKYRRKIPRYLSYLLSKLTGKDLTTYPFYSNPLRYYMMLRNNIYLLTRHKVEITYSKYLPLFVLYLYENLGLKETLKYVLRAMKYGIFGNLDNDNKGIFNSK